jgi:hypothetical protein
MDNRMRRDPKQTDILDRRRQSTWRAFRFVCFVGFAWAAVLVVSDHSPKLVFAANAPVGMATNALGTFRVLRSDGIEEQLEGKGTLPLFEGDVLTTEGSSQALIEFNNGINVALNEQTMFTILSRWEKDKGFTRVLRLKQGEVWVDTQGGPKPLEIETPVATAAVQGTEFNLLVSPDGQSTLTVINGIVEFGTAFNTWSVRPSRVSVAVRGKRCTKPRPIDVQSTISWTEALN